MRFNANEIVSVIEQEIVDYRSQLETREVGRVLEVGDGIARVYGLSSVMSNEMVEFPPTDNHKEPVLATRVDPALLGGLVVRVGDWLYDGSVRTRLENIRKQLIERGSHVQA